MAYHQTNLGRFAPTNYADLDGYIPQAGDRWQDLRWDGATEWDDDSWAEHVGEAVAATERAEQELAAWEQQ